MRNLILTAIISLGIFGLVGCGETTANKTANANSETTNTEKPAANVLKPGDVSADKPVGVSELMDAVTADQDGWKDKEIAITGYVTGTSGSGGKFGYSLTIKNDQKASSSENLLSCKVPNGDLPKGLLSKTVEVKGTIKEITDRGIKIRLDPCELKTGDEKPSDEDDKSASTSGDGASSPTEAVKTFSAGMKDKDPAKVKSVLTADSVKMLETGAKNDGEESLDAFIKSGKGGKQFALDGEFRNEKINGDAATIEAKSNGKWEPIMLAKENGNWKIAFDKN